MTSYYWSVLSKSFFKAAPDDQTLLHHLDWAALTLETGFSDQAHLICTAKRITGFPPTKFSRRFVEDGSFWMYRLWT